jgi:hypothetical protein
MKPTKLSTSDAPSGAPASVSPKNRQAEVLLAATGISESIGKSSGYQQLQTGASAHIDTDSDEEDAEVATWVGLFGSSQAGQNSAPHHHKRRPAPGVETNADAEASTHIPPPAPEDPATRPPMQPHGPSQRTLRLQKLVSQAEADLHAEGFGEEEVCVDPKDDHAVVKFLTRNNSKSAVQDIYMMRPDAHLVFELFSVCVLISSLTLFSLRLPEYGWLDTVQLHPLRAPAAPHT